MSFTTTILNSREEWLEHRIGIGASEISSALGCGFKTPLQLWKEKTGQVKAPDLSDNERVKFGNEAEEPLRAIFRVMHPKYELTFEPYMILRREDEYDFLFDTPDGLLVEKETGRRGLYESKTSTCLSRKDWDKWNEKIPDAYFCQICQGMFVGDFDFAVVWALLLNSEGDGTLRIYEFERADCEWKIEEIKREGKKFWKHVVDGTMPPVLLNI